MSDIPDDLPSVGSHQGNQPPDETGQTVSSPEGPDPSASDAQPAETLFQLIDAASEGRLEIRTHPPRAQAAPPEGEAEEIGQYRTVEALRAALSEASIDGWTGVFKNPTADRVLTDDVTPDHAWIGASEYDTIVLFSDADAASDFAASLDRSST